MIKKLVLLILVPIFLFTGCWDRNELEEWGYVAVIGVDKTDDGKLKVTFQTANPQVGTTLKGNTKEPPEVTVTLPAYNIITVKNLVSTSLTRRLTLTHAYALVVSEEFAKTDEFYRAVCTLVRDRDVRDNLNIIVSKEKAEDFIKGNNPKLETRPHKFYYFMTKRWKDAALVTNSPIHTFIQRTELDNGLFISIYGTSKLEKQNKLSKQESDYLPGEIGKEGGNPTEFIGSAVFKKGKMIGTLTGEETQVALLIRSKHNITATSMNIPDPLDKKHYISINILPAGNPKIEMDLSNEIPKVETNIGIKVNILGIPSGIDYITDKENRSLLINSIEDFLKSKGNDLINRTQKEFKGEPFLWGYEAQKHFKTTQEISDYNWMEKYPDAKIDVSFTIKNLNNGRILNPTTLNNRDNK